MRVAVLGGGITGLVATHLLLEKGHDVSCFEAAPRCGGLCQSEVVDGFVADQAGGHILFSKDAEVLQFMMGLLEGVGYHTSRRETYIHIQGRFVQYPFENGLADLPKELTLTCLRDYIQASYARSGGAPEPADFHSWCLWRFGQGICDLFMHPYNEKIWNVSLKELGVQWVSGRVPDAPMEDVLRSALGIRTEGYAHQAVFHYPLEGGFESLVRGLLARIPEGVVRTSTVVRSVERTPTGFRVDGKDYDRLVSTIPLQELAATIDDMPDSVRAAFDSLDHTSLMTVFLALDKDDAPPHSWIYFPDAADGPQNRITWLSNYSPRNAPPGKSSLMAEVTYHGHPPGTDEEVTANVVSGLERAGFIRKEQILFTRVWHNPYAYILYLHGLETELERVRQWCASIGLDVAGRFGNYSYFNSDMCVRAVMDLVKSRYAHP